jgi:hypothetical protein
MLCISRTGLDVPSQPLFVLISLYYVMKSAHVYFHVYFLVKSNRELYIERVGVQNFSLTDLRYLHRSQITRNIIEEKTNDYVPQYENCVYFDLT